jgi:RNA polymerase sigma factor (sigma-70 family)
MMGFDAEQLYAESFPRTYAFAYRMLGDRDAALDAAQEAFAIALRHAASFRGDSAPLTWLLAITRNECLRRLEARRKGSFSGLEAIIERHAQPPTSVESDVERRAYVAQVKEGCLIGLLQCLPVAQRTVFVLHLLNDISIADTARIIGRSDNAVRILLSRARSRMRAFLCRNCTLLGGTTCACENMIEFSLRRDLIERHPQGMRVEAIRDELGRFADEVALYRSLPDPTDRIRELVSSGRFAVLSAK